MARDIDIAAAEIRSLASEVGLSLSEGTAAEFVDPVCEIFESMEPVEHIPDHSSTVDSITAADRADPHNAFITSCLVERAETPAIERRARSIIEETGFYGISEAEFVHDRERGEYVLLDVNTRPWKWIGLPVQAGTDLPYAAYADTVGTTYQPGPVRDAAWVYLPDYLASLAEGGQDRLARAEWRRLASGAFEGDAALTTAVYAPSDPGPIVQLLLTEFGDREYYCSC